MFKRSNTVAADKNREVLPLEGEIDLHVSPRIAASIRELVAKKPSQLLVDL